MLTKGQLIVNPRDILTHIIKTKSLIINDLKYYFIVNKKVKKTLIVIN